MLNNRVAPGIFRRVFILFAVIMALAVLFIELAITDAVRENTIRQFRNSLTVQADLIGASVVFRPSPELNSTCRQLKKRIGSRVTLITRDGTVIADSDGDARAMENHAHRREIQQAALNGTGMAIRSSDTLKHDFLYVAVQAAHGRDNGFVRLAMPLQEVDASVNLLRLKILTVVLSVLLAAGLFSLSQIERIRKLTGQVRDFARDLAAGQTGKKLFLSQPGEFDEIAGSLNSMSEELRSSLSCHEEEQHRLNMILRNIPDALFIIDRKGMITLSSVAARKLFGEIALQGKPFIEVVRNSEFLSLMETVRTEQSPGSVELRLDSPLEQYCVVQVSPLFYTERELSGFVAIFHDITQLKRLEQTRKDFVANISHEIRTPIAAIQGFADTLLQGALEDREHAVKFLGTIRANSQRINNLVEDLLTISKLELGAIRVEPAPVDISEAAGQVIALFREKAAAKNISLQTRLLPEHNTLHADRDRLIQVLANLVDNALKFTDSGSITIGSEHHNGKYCLFVEDTGIGIAAKHIPRLGERFYRVDPGRSRNMGGTGLGLAIVKHLVKAHGWDMQIESTPNKGTKVRLLLDETQGSAPFNS